MEGLLINAVLRELAGRLPARSLGWAFPDEGTAALLVEGLGNLVLRYRPPHPLLTLEPGSLEGEAKTAFQRSLAARAKGRLLKAEQLKLDRVVFFELEGESGFVDTPPTRLIFELTGRNANLLLTTPEGRILTLDREVTQQVNRFRELRPGLTYTPPPPYHKLDPRTAGPGDLERLLGLSLSQAASKHLDGLGKELTLELARRAGLPPQTVLSPEHLAPLHRALKSLVERPSGTPEHPSLATELRAEWERQEAEALRRPLREALRKRIHTLEARLADYHRALARLDEVPALREKGNVLLAYLHRVPGGAASVTLEDFTGKPLEIALDPTLTPAQNAERYYGRARRLEALAERAMELQPRTQAQLEALRQEIAGLEKATLPELLKRLQRKEESEEGRVGLRLRSPGGFAVWVGRNAKENDFLTRSAHSMDLWFHAQGIPGSHVILRTQGQPAPLPDLLFAAQLAAYHSKARGERNVAVDYTAKKNVWRPRKAAPGQVLYTGAKTLFVDAEDPSAPSEGVD
ncbi:Rqc2 family fibronectin-binding protein [Calidithermus timidus]|jgi:predicted ribosome quality control (RQC) complex YloA/Tae2 family protein|uniref:Rqc2 family fibronectin-binding protein n=1 Tax=Calidithermus timidus TaxID=307124 RepID=UPI000382071D|nr:NFACT family protein [Calidithermus timidus]